MATIKKHKIAHIRLGDIVIDPTYQVRAKLDNTKQTISNYKAIIESYGYNPFPPIVVEKETNKLVCGFTRIEVYKKLYTPDDTIESYIVSFKNPKERLIYSIKDNNHGEPLTSWDKKNLIFRLNSLGMKTKEISKTLGWVTSNVENFLVKVKPLSSKTKTSKTSKESNITPLHPAIPELPFVIVSGKKKPVKGGLKHLFGKKISPKVYENICQHYTGWSCQYLASQLLMRCDDNTLNLSDPNTKGTLEELSLRILAILDKNDCKYSC